MTSAQLLGSGVQRVHIVGIAGAGMSGIATALLDLKLGVSGSDIRSTSTTDRLRSEGATIRQGHAADHVKEADLVVHSAAVPACNVELAEARKRGVPVTTRAAIIAELFNESQGIAVAGTHGKSTTGAMTASVLRETGHDPSFLLGAASPSLGGTNGRYRRGSWMVVEADEFDSAFLSYQPDIAVLTHLDRDHIDYFGSEPQMREAFRAFITGVPTTAHLVARGDIPELREVASQAVVDTIWFGAGEAWDLRSYTAGPNGTQVDFHTPHGSFTHNLKVRGRHNAWNAVAALAASTLAGVDAAEAASALASFEGTERRLEVRSCGSGIIVLEDYAHHPTAVRATINAAREFASQRLWAIYQPLLRSRTLDLICSFEGAFEGADRVTFAEIYSPPGREEGVTASSSLLAARVEHPDAIFLPSFDAIAELVTAEATDGDLILIMGPESVTPLANRISAWVDTRTAT